MVNAVAMAATSPVDTHASAPASAAYTAISTAQRATKQAGATTAAWRATDELSRARCSPGSTAYQLVEGCILMISPRLRLASNAAWPSSDGGSTYTPRTKSKSPVLSRALSCSRRSPI
eukprot:7357476-Prymnesium_polylepis.1